MGATCTLDFSVPPLNPRACSATNETSDGGMPVAVGTATTTLVINSLTPWNPGYVISYICASY
jgi:hypothetical protein